VDIEASARKHDVGDEDMLHGYRHHWRAFAADDASVTMFVGPGRDGAPLEIGVVVDDEGEAIRSKFSEGWWKP